MRARNQSPYHCFSDDNEIGYGGFARVYKGKLDNGTVVAVKKLLNTVDIDEKKFIEELRCLMKAKQKNIVRFLGYCSDTQGEMLHFEGELVLAEVRQRVLCFEYLPKGSLDKQITDASCGLEWSMRYQIITGICDGLHYLHQKRILHLDLKPENVLLDDTMMPKIADFGLSRCFDEKQSRAITSKLIGTLGYLAPEFYGGHLTFKLDIYSLGIIIIEMLTAEKGYPNIANVLERWRNRLQKTQVDTQMVQVRVCTEIAIHCTDSDPSKRPDIQDIVDRLGATKSADESAGETRASCSSSVAQAAVPPADLTIAVETRASCSSSVAQAAVPPAGPTIGRENTMANEVKKSGEELYNITNRNGHFSSVPDNSSNVQYVTDIRETSSDVEEALIIGRTEEKQKIVATLSGSITPEFTVLPIYGIGGIGKTTLAQLVFNDAQFNGYSRVWVYVSQNLELNKIGNSIISQLSDESHVAEKQMIHNHLRKLLSGKKILIVLDDVWEKNPHTLKTLKAMLRLGAGSMVTIIVTTRDEAIAREICHSAEPYKLEILTNKMCWTIIKQKTAFKDRDNKKPLKHIGREIATKCGGVALAAQSLGYMLMNMKYSDEWESVRDSYIWNLSNSEGSSSGYHEVLASLLLSYSHMPDWLKLCFSYCAVFPKGHLIAKYDLIHQWIALGFPEQSSPFDSMQLCEKYVTQLLGMSFLQYSKTQPPSDEQQDKDVTLFTMHDLVHNLATAILADRVNKKGNVVGSSCHYALLTDCSKPLQLSPSSLENTLFKIFFNLFHKRSSFENIKALFFLDCGKIELCDAAFSPAKCLLVLDLSQCFIRKLPDSIGQLKQLRFLRAPQIQNQMIPDCITDLSELNYLNLRGSCNISALPKSIGDLKGLMHLDLSGCGQIRELPKSFAELKQLVHLDLSDCPVSISVDLGDLSKLQYKDMAVSDDFCGLTKLQYLNLSVPSGYIGSVYRSGLLDFIGNLNKLRYLNLSQCMKDSNPVSLLDSISTLSNLEHLDLSGNAGLSSIPESMGNLRKLHTLDLLGCSQLKKLPDSMVKMVSLKVLIVEDWVTLDGYVLSVLNIASLPHFVVHASNHKCSSNIIRLQHTNPIELTIDRLENVKSLEEAHSIKLIEKQKIKELKFQWTVAAGRFVDDKEVLEKLVPPSSVKKLSITGYRSASFPDWLMGMRQHLTNLSEINVCDFPNCNYLLPLGQLPKLELLSLCRMEGLEEWNMTYTSGEEGVNELMFPKLNTLRITQCSKLKLIGNTQQLSRLESLSLSHCGSMTSIPWLGEITSLKKFDICDCEAIRSFPDSIQKLSNLEYLHVDGCPKLIEWYDLKENRMKLAHIRDTKLYRGRSAKAPEEGIAETFEGTTNKGKKPVNIEETIDLIDELHTDLLYSAVMDMPGFTEEALLVALSHLMDNNAQGSAYMGMHEEDRLSWLMNFLKKHY